MKIALASRAPLAQTPGRRFKAIVNARWSLARGREPRSPRARWRRKYGHRHVTADLVRGAGPPAWKRDHGDPDPLHPAGHRLPGSRQSRAGRHTATPPAWSDASRVCRSSESHRSPAGPGLRGASILRRQRIHMKIAQGEIAIQQRRVRPISSVARNQCTGHPRPWTDHLLWHHAAILSTVRLPRVRP